ncbi:MAG: ABC transporter permease [Bacteroidota bacterium]
MRTLRFLLQKEFRQIFRNKSLLPMLFIAPIIQLIILPFAADYEVKDVAIAVVDHDHSPYSAKLINAVSSSGYFKLIAYPTSYKDAYRLIESDKADIILEIPQHFERNLIREGSQPLYIAVNAINGTKAGLGGAYLNSIIGDYNNSIRMEWLPDIRSNTTATVEVVSSNWYNPLMNYHVFMVPGILAILVTMVGGYMSALNIVKEKEIGTIEQINVTPIKKYHFILGKLIPFWVIGMFVFTVGLLGVARFVYGIVPVGSLLLLYSFLAVYLASILGFGLLISTFAETQQQAMSIAFFFIMIFNLMSGLFTPIESMPHWAQMIAWCNPVSYFNEVMRMVVLKGSTFNDVKHHLLIVVVIGVILNTWAILNYRKTSG